MKTLLTISLSFIVSCGGGITNFNEEISGNYVFANRGEGFNGISGGEKNQISISWVKKYDNDGKFISVWQADSAMMNAENFNYAKHKKNTYYQKDRFYIIEIKTEKVEGPYTKSVFFTRVKALNMDIQWKPKIKYK